ncbi:MAG: amidohydrolase family protein [Betaproteobacteria bacterium]|nr:amidohydrolase family protein [Betaproteobacteria bacterium]
MNRRGFLGAAAAAACASALAGCRYSLEQGLFNECRSPGGHRLFRDRVVRAAWEGVDSTRVWDCHAHLFGNGRTGSGIYLNPGFDRPSTLAGQMRRALFFNAACGEEDEERLDRAVVERLAHLADELPVGAKVMLLAFDFTHDADGTRREDQTTFAVPDNYAARVASARPDRFEWIASVHPYRRDAFAALSSAHTAGARAVKWLPQAMGIDLAHARSIAFYAELRRLGLPLLVHVGEEQAVEGAGRHALGNPLALRHPLDAGVRVVAAHCASLGESPDLDAHPDSARAPRVRNLDLFARLMRDPRYANLLYGDLSAVTQANRAATVPELIEATAWHARLLNGTDYPLPGIMPIFSVQGFVRAGMLEEASARVLTELRHVNPLAFDFVLKRSLAWRGARFPAAVFETRHFFDTAHREA